MYRFNGTDITRMFKYTGKGNTVIELFKDLEGRITDWSDYDSEVLKKSGKTTLYANNEYGYFDNDKWIAWDNSQECIDNQLTDDEILNLITECRSNAYYQKIYQWNGINEDGTDRYKLIREVAI